MPHSAGGFSWGLAFAIGRTAHAGISSSLIWDASQWSQRCSSLSIPHHYHQGWKWKSISLSLFFFLSSFKGRKCKNLYFDVHINSLSALCKFACITKIGSLVIGKDFRKWTLLRHQKAFRVHCGDRMMEGRCSPPSTQLLAASPHGTLGSGRNSPHADLTSLSPVPLCPCPSSANSQLI